MNRAQAGSLGALTGWAFNREQKLKDAEKARAAFMGRFRNEAEKRLYFKRLGMRPKRKAV